MTWVLKDVIVKLEKYNCRFKNKRQYCIKYTLSSGYIDRPDSLLKGMVLPAAVKNKPATGKQYLVITLILFCCVIL